MTGITQTEVSGLMRALPPLPVVGEMAWEAALPVYAIWKGFNPSAITSPETRQEVVDPALSAA